MAIHFVSKIGRFKNAKTGRFVSKAKAMRSSVARREYKAFTEAKIKPKESPPWFEEGVIKEYPDAGEWFPDHEVYTYDQLIEDWGYYNDEEIDS